MQAYSPGLFGTSLVHGFQEVLSTLKPRGIVVVRNQGSTTDTPSNNSPQQIQTKSESHDNVTKLLSDLSVSAATGTKHVIAKGKGMLLTGPYN
ncbi:hypothetical protein FBU31_006845 [Coemansia sp. 'formosensis']|nr:hypothetical protein FBU31_006845 [Coemansia sp. 'formosensis']